MAVLRLLLSWASQALLFLLFVLFVAFLGYCLYIKYTHMRYDHIPGPPRDSFFLGHTPTFLRVMKSDGIIHDKFLEWSETYGPVYKIHVLHFVLLGTTCPETTKEVLMSPKYPKDKFLYKRLFFLFGERFLGNGLVTSLNHDQWYKQRRIMDPAFSSLYLRGLMGTFNETAEHLMTKLTAIAEEKTEAKMLHLFNCVTLDVITKVAFGVNLDLENNNSPLPKAVGLCLQGMVYYVRDTFFEYNPKNRPFINEVRDACRLLRTIGAQWIQERKTAIQNNDDVPKDILTQIIKSAGKGYTIMGKTVDLTVLQKTTIDTWHKEGKTQKVIDKEAKERKGYEESMSKEDEEFMLDNFLTFFIAGQETTANQLAFCVMELARHPDILEKVKKEVDDVIGMKQEITYDDLGKLTYLGQVLKETLRIYPTVPGTSRDILEDIVIDDIKIPGGFTCLFSSYVTGRMDKFFKDPLTFDPDRFHPDAPKPYYCYYPFALGPRSCLGQNFAQMESKVVMAKFLQRFDFSLIPGQSFGIMDNATLRPKSGVVCSVKHRDDKK